MNEMSGAADRLWNKTLDMIKGEYKIMDQKVLAVVGGHEITDKEVDAFIKSLPREQQA